MCLGHPATIVDLDAGAHVRGTGRADVILTGSGNDVIEGQGGDDRICSGGGDDRITGGAGSDLVDADAGDDVIEGGNGSDRLMGGLGSDTVAGERGNDLLYGGPGGRDFVDGGLGDDTVHGGSGDFDQVIGGVGNDKLYGGSGSGDVLRGDHGADLFDGGPGEHDLASFAVSGENGITTGGKGVVVNLASGEAANDGSDRLTGIEDVVGTAFHDMIVGDSSANDLYGGGGNDELRASGPGDFAAGGPGSDTCQGFSSEESCGAEPPNPAAHVEVDLAGGPGATTLTSVVRQGEFLPQEIPIQSLQGVQIEVSFEPGAWLLKEEPLPISVGDRCVLIAPTLARCPIEGKPDAVYLDGGRGDDRLEIGPTVPSYVSAFMKGEYGVDTVIGGSGDDSLEGIPSGTPYPVDTLVGGGGDDALSYGKVMAGGPGSDLLIANACDGESISGGAGIDSASFARASGELGVDATLGGTAVFPPITRGSHRRPRGCPGPDVPPSRIDRTAERIEGSHWDDTLRGDASANTLLGRGGDDSLLGAGGNDILVGGAGRDQLLGEAGTDRLYAGDGHRDSRIDCGPGPIGGIAVVDRSDPPARHCRLVK